MKTPRNVDVVGTRHQLEQLVNSLKKRDSLGSWQLTEEFSRKSLDSSLVFKYTRAQVPYALLWISTRDAERLCISNIVPLVGKRIFADEYNRIAGEFVQDILEPLCRGIGCDIKFGPEERTVETELSAKTLKALKRFLDLANPSTGNSHPEDSRRWNDFVIQSHQDQSIISHDVFMEHLTDREWDEDIADDLYSDYESGLSLLTRYDTRADDHRE